MNNLHVLFLAIFMVVSIIAIYAKNPFKRKKKAELF